MQEQRRVALLLVLSVLVLAAGCTAPAKWYRGNIHTHSLWSDGNDFPEQIVAWYAEHGYHFLAISDHNILSRGERWMPVKEIERRGGADALRKYREKFGDDWVKTRETENGTGVRLRALEEFRDNFETAGRFLLIEGEEITDRFERREVHMNATNLEELIPPQGGTSVRDVMRRNLLAVREQEDEVGRPILAHLNHPNFTYAITAEDIAAVVEEHFFEVYNGHRGVRHLGDATHPPVERLWDIANTIRIDRMKAAPLYGVATDDAHHYHGKSNTATTGRGWIEVRSPYLQADSLIGAMRLGRFYASSGVRLKDVRYREGSKTLTVEIAPQPGATYRVSFIGTREGYDKTSEPTFADDGSANETITRKYSTDVGETLAVVEGTTASYTLRGDELYVRARIDSSLPVDNPAFDDQRRQAWTQPVGWRKRVTDAEMR